MIQGPHCLTGNRPNKLYLMVCLLTGKVFYDYIKKPYALFPFVKVCSWDFLHAFLQLYGIHC